jgi:hypothetical protein
MRSRPAWSHLTLLERQASQLYDGRERRMPDVLRPSAESGGAADAGAGLEDEDGDAMS